MTPQQAVAKMTRGINLGRCMDMQQEGDAQTIQEYLFEDIKNAGFNFVRVPIQWDQHTATNAPYTVDATWLNRVQQVVDWGLKRGLIIIINSHHDYWILENNSYTASDLARFKAIWTQAADRFSTNSANLLFEIANEPNIAGSLVNQINSSIVPIIRSNNPTRIIIYGGSGTQLSTLKTATISNTSYLMASFHTYVPWTFAGLGQGTWGTDAEEQVVTNLFNDALAWAQQHNIPLLLGEYGTVGNIDRPSRELYIAAHVAEASRTGIAPCIWNDFGSFGIYYPNNSPATRWSYVKDVIMANSQPANQPPTLNALGNLSISQSTNLQTVNLTGISAGAGNEAQPLTVTAVSSNPSLIPTPAVTYTSPNATGMLTFTPTPYATGVTTITVTVDDGQVISNTLSRTFTVTVNPLPNLPFAITAISFQTNLLSLTWASTAGKSYAIEYSRDLLTWSNLVTAIPAVGTNTSVVLNLVSSNIGPNEILVQYQMGQAGPQIQNPTNTLAGGNLTKGSGLNLFDPLSSILYPTAPSLAVTFNATTPDLTTALGNNSFFTFTLTVGANVTDLDLNSLTFNAARGGGGIPRGFAVFVTTPTTTNQQIQADTQLTTQRTNWGPLQNINLSGFTSLQNLTANQTVTFKIPVYSPATTSSLDFDNLTLYGKSTFGSALANIGTQSVYFRIRQ